ncbi:hypothetical protein GCM10017687_24600 [Streptomyces echinatus]
MQKHRRKKHFRNAAIAVAALGMVGIATAAMASQETSQAAAAAPSSTSPTAKVVALVNKERAKAGCRALKVNAKLTKAAQNHSKDQSVHHRMSHTGSDGSNPGSASRVPGTAGAATVRTSPTATAPLPRS